MLYRLDRVLEYLSALETGATREAAAPLLCVTPRRLRQILNKGIVELVTHGPQVVDSIEAIEEGLYEAGRLMLYTQRSEARAEAQLAASLWAAAVNGSVKAQLSLLERRFPERWARIDRKDARALPVPGAPGEQKPARPGLTPEMAESIRRDVLGIKPPVSSKVPKPKPPEGDDV